MNLIKQPNKWSCLPTSFAMVLDISLEDIYNFLGHDGSEIWFDDPNPWRSFNIQEMISLSEAHGFWVMEIITKPAQQPPNSQEFREVYDLSEANRRINFYINKYSGVMILRIPHAVAWNHEEQRIYDPRGDIHEVESDIEAFYAMGRIL